MINGQKMIGADKIVVPKDGDAEGWNKVYDRLGRPESPDKYDLGGFKPPETVPWNAELQTEVLGAMHEAGANSKQVTAALNAYGKGQEAAIAKMNAALDAQVEAGIEQLKTDWGGDFDRNVTLANRSAEELFGADFEAARNVKDAAGNNVLDNPVFVRMLQKAGVMMTEDGFHGSAGGGRGNNTATPEGAAAEAKRIRDAASQDPAHPYRNRRHPEHQQYQKRMLDLERKAGEKS